MDDLVHDHLDMAPKPGQCRQSFYGYRLQNTGEVEPQRRSRGLDALAETLPGSALPATAHRSSTELSPPCTSRASRDQPNRLLSRAIGAVGRGRADSHRGASHPLTVKWLPPSTFTFPWAVPMRTVDGSQRSYWWR